MERPEGRADVGNPGQLVRLLARAGAQTRSTAGLAHGFGQANLVVLPETLASDFLRFCQRNPKSCPLLDVSEPGSFRFPSLGADLDIRTDLLRYRVWQAGELVAEPTDVEAYWQADLASCCRARRRRSAATRRSAGPISTPEALAAESSRFMTSRRDDGRAL